MTGNFGRFEEAYRQVHEGKDHESKFSHELIAGAASFAGMKAWEDRQRHEGISVKHGFAKELIAGLVGAEVDKLAETKGLSEVDRLRAHDQAKQNVHEMDGEYHQSNHHSSEMDSDKTGYLHQSQIQQSNEQDLGRSLSADERNPVQSDHLHRRHHHHHHDEHDGHT